MERFNLSFRRIGKFYMEGDCQVELDVQGAAMLSDVVAKAQQQDFTAMRPTKVEFFEDEWVFGRAQLPIPTVALVTEQAPCVQEVEPTSFACEVPTKEEPVG